MIGATTSRQRPHARLDAAPIERAPRERQRRSRERICDRRPPVRKTTQQLPLARRRRCSAAKSGPLGHFIRSQSTNMGLDCLPMRCPCGNHKTDRWIPRGLTHLKDEPCPFKDDDFPIGAFATCCSLRGKAAARELAALGEVPLSDRMHEDMTAEEAPAFAAELHEAAARLEATHANDAVKPKGAAWGEVVGWDDKGQPICTSFTPFEEAVATIREAARWYEKVSTLGFGVDAWF